MKTINGFLRSVSVAALGACLLGTLLSADKAWAAEQTQQFGMIGLGDGQEDGLKRLPVGAVRPSLNVRFIDGSAGPTWGDLRGKVVVVDFWATWCAPCVASIPHMNTLKKELVDQPVRLLSITYEPSAKVREFLKTHPLDTDVLIDNDLATFQSFIAWGIPITYILDRDGRVVAGLSPRDLTAEMVRTVVAGKTPVYKVHTGWDDPAGAAKYFRAQLEEDRKKYGRD